MPQGLPSRRDVRGPGIRVLHQGGPTKADLLLVPGEDLRLSPSPGGEAFAGRLRLRFRERGKRISARRPLTETEARELVRVLRRWKVAAHPALWRDLPPDLRVEVAIGGCDPPPPQDKKSTGRKP